MAGFRDGDVFLLPLPGGDALEGRVLLDVSRQARRPGLIDRNSPFNFYGGQLLVEIERAPGEVLIPGVFTSAEALRQGLWPVIGYREVDPYAVEFPEVLHLINNRWHLVRGEVLLMLPVERMDLQYDVRPVAITPYRLPQVCLYHLGRVHEIDPALAPHMNLHRADLRFTAYRSSVYEALGLDLSESYRALSLRMGFDLTRFYRPRTKR